MASHAGHRLSRHLDELHPGGTLGMGVAAWNRSGPAKSFDMGRLGARHSIRRQGYYMRRWRTVMSITLAHLRRPSVGRTALPLSRFCAWRLTAKHE